MEEIRSIKESDEQDEDSELVDTTSPLDDYEYSSDELVSSSYSTDDCQSGPVDQELKETKRIIRPKVVDKNNNKSNQLSEMNKNNEPTANSTTTSSKSPNKLIAARKKLSHRRRNIISGNNYSYDNDHDGDIDDDNNLVVEDNKINSNCALGASANKRKQQEKSTFLLRPRLQAQPRNKLQQQYQDSTTRGYIHSSDNRQTKNNIASSDRSGATISSSKCNYLLDKKESFYNLKSSQPSNKRNNIPQCNELSATKLSYVLKLYLFITKLINNNSNQQQSDCHKSVSSDLSTEEEEGEVTEDNLIQKGRLQHRKVNFNLHKKRGNNHSHEQASDECESSQTTMPSTSNRYQPLQGLDDIRPQRKTSSRNRTHRLSGASGYSRLNHNYHQLKPKQEQDFCQELKRFLLLLAIIALSCFILWQLYRMLTAEYNYLGVIQSSSKLGHYNHYAVSTDAKPCAKVGSSLLAKGGSAVDAAVGTLICMGVIIPNSLGIGGGGLITIYDAKKKEAVVVDGREEAPDYATENMFSNNPLSASRGPLSIGIPGELSACYKAHQMYGKLSWNQLFDDSIEMAEKGFPLVEHLSYALRTWNHAQYIDHELAKIYTNPKTGQYFAEGEILVQPQLAETLKRIRDNGAQEFYNGTTGRLFIEDLQKQGGKITLENLSRYQALVKKPLRFKLADDLILNTVPLPGSGIVLSVILRIMKELGYYKNLKPGSSFEGSSLYYHRLAEALKFAYASRAGLEDMPDDEKRIQDLIGKLSSDEFIKSVVQKIDNSTHNDDRYGGSEFFSLDHGTAHVSVVDGQGNAVAITSSVNLYFGSGLVSPRTGITYNDVMDDFVSPKITNKFGLAPSKYNHIKPGRRPISSMAPSIFTDSEGNVRLVIGASGGAKITSAVAAVSLRHCYLGDDIKTAIDGPRIHHQFLPNKVFYEQNFSKDLLKTLAARGHELELIKDRSSIIMAVAVNNKMDANGTLTRYITANSDYRKGGAVDGV